MNQDSPNREGIRKPVLLAIVVAAVVVVGGFVIAKLRGGKSGTAAEAPPEEPAVEMTHAKPEPPAVEATPPAPVEPAPPAVVTPATPRPPGPAAAAAPPVSPIPPGPEPSAQTRALVSALANLDLNPAALTPESAAAFKQNLQALVQNGAAAVPAIQEFLALDKDVNFEAVPGAANALGSTSLRLSLLDALGHIGGPEAIALSAQALQSTIDPREIALLAGSLERQAPEQYREMALAAARTALAQANSTAMNGRDIGPLFGVLTQLAGPNAIQDLEQAASGQWKYYATIALAQLPEGAGIPALVQMVSDPKNPSGGGRLAALQMLGQSAADNPDARNALLDQARRGTIPAATWINIAAALGGEVYQIGRVDAQSVPNVRTWHLNYGNQNYYAAPGALTADQINQRVTLIDQFLSANPGEAATFTLQDAKSKLQNRLGPPPGGGQ